RSSDLFKISLGWYPARENSSRNEFDRAVIVPTSERDPPAEVRCSRATVGGIPSTISTWGSTAEPMSRRANGATDSKYLRCASPWIVPKAKDDFPEPDTLVNARTVARGNAPDTL